MERTTARLQRLKLIRGLRARSTPEDEILVRGAEQVLAEVIANGVQLSSLSGGPSILESERDRLAHVAWAAGHLHGEHAMAPILADELRIWEPGDLETAVSHLHAAIDVVDFLRNAMREGDEIELVIQDAADAP